MTSRRRHRGVAPTLIGICCLASGLGTILVSNGAAAVVARGFLPDGGSHDVASQVSGLAAIHRGLLAFGIDASSGSSWGFNGVSCNSATACIAVGDYVNGASAHGELPSSPFAETWTGDKWVVRVPTASADGTSGAVLTGVSCGSVGSCMAVGYSSRLTFTEELGEKASVVEHTPRESNAILKSISCSTTEVCTAVGYSSTNSGLDSFLLAERWSDDRWTAQPTPSAAGTYLGEFYGVSCPSPADCTAVGSNSVGESDFALVESWEHGAWSLQTTPREAGSILEAVSCASPSACTAVGTGPKGALAERWNGNSWEVESTPEVPRAEGVQLQSVSCISTTTCTAVGFYSRLGVYFPLAERWSDRAWSVETVPSPAGAALTSFHAVSCPTNGVCMAVGLSSKRGGAELGLAERWDGTSWIIEPMGAPQEGSPS